LVSATVLRRVAPEAACSSKTFFWSSSMLRKVMVCRDQRPRVEQIESLETDLFIML